MPPQSPPKPAAGGDEDDSQKIGQRLRQLRTAQGLTITQLAERAEVSAGIISQIERGNANPSIKTMQLIRAALGVNLWEFLGDTRSTDKASTYIRRKAERPKITVGKTQLAKELLSPRSDRNLRFMMITLPPGGESEDVIIGDGEKGGLVMSGQVQLTVAGETHDLFKGDSCQFPSSLPHRICNPSDQPASLIWIMSMLDSHI